MKQNKSAPESVLWFDLFDWPFTKTELWRFAPEKESLNFSNPNKNGIKSIGYFNGFYFLQGKNSLFKKRIIRQKIVIKKIKIAKKAAEILSFIPFIKMIALCNDVAYFNAPKESDIDFFIVAKSGKIWTVRILSVITLFFFGVWRHKKKIKNRICLSFFVCENNLDISAFSYENDILLKYWTPCHFPLFSKEKTYQKFLENNSWIKNDFPNYLKNIPSPKIFVKQKLFQELLEKLLNNKFGDATEKFFKFVQLRIMKKETPWQKDKDVIISDKILKFHENDRRKHFKKIFEEKLSQQ